MKNTILLKYTPMLKKMYLYTYDIVHTAVSYESELIVCSFLQDFYKGKGSSLQLICNAHTVFSIYGADFERCLIVKGGTATPQSKI